MLAITAHNYQKIALVIAAYQPTALTSDILRAAIRSFLHFKHEDACVWVVDVDSPKHGSNVTHEEFPEVNFIVTDYEPLALSEVHRNATASTPESNRHAAIANGLTYDVAVDVFQSLHYIPSYMMTLQMDVLATASNWLDCLLRLFDAQTAAVGVRSQLSLGKQEIILHSLGCLWNYSVVRNMDFSFMPVLPDWDTGEAIVAQAKRDGWRISALQNTYTEPPLVASLRPPYNLIHADRSIDENGDVVFMHLGRGVAKSVSGETATGKTSPEEWLNFARTSLK